MVKKKSDVTSVLKGADENRRALFEKQFSEYARRKRNFESAASEIQTSGSSVDESISSESSKISDLRVDLQETNSQIRSLNEEMADTADDNAISTAEWRVRALDDQYEKAQSLLRNYDDITDGITQVNNSIASKTDKLKAILYREEQKKLALSKIDEVKQRIEHISYEDPIDSSKKMGLRDATEFFIDDVSTYDEIISGLDLIGQLVNGSKNLELDGQLFVIGQTIANLEEKISEKVLDAKETIQTTIAIEDALKEIGYTYETKMSGDSILDGVSIITTDPAKLMFNLENVVVHNDDGTTQEDLKVEFNVDAAPGSCALTAKSLATRLRTSGINFEITDWGTANEPSGSTSTTTNKTQIG